MQRQCGELVPIGEVLSGLDDGPVPAIRDASPQALHHFTRADQVNQLVSASEADPDRGFMARMMALCSLPRTNPGNRLRYVRQNGPYKLGMTAGIDSKLPFGNFPRLILAWVCTEAVKTQSRELVLGRSLSEFMRALGLEPVGGVRTRLRNQMNRLFACTVSLIYEDESSFARVTSSVADKHEFWWNERKPNEPSLWNSKIYLGEAFYNEIIRPSRTARYEHPHSPQTLRPGPRPVSMAGVPDLSASCSATDHLAAGIPSVRLTPGQGQ